MTSEMYEPTPWLRSRAQEFLFQALERGAVGRCIHAARKPNREAFVALWMPAPTITCKACTSNLDDPPDNRCDRCFRPNQALHGGRALLGGESTWLAFVLCSMCRLAEVVASGEAG